MDSDDDGDSFDSMMEDGGYRGNSILETVQDGFATDTREATASRTKLVLRTEYEWLAWSRRRGLVQGRRVASCGE